jgi:cytochrome c oxidase subunit 2
MSLLFKNPLNLFLDIPESWQLGFQAPASPTMEGIINLHHDIMFYIVVIVISVMWVLGRFLTKFNLEHRTPFLAPRPTLRERFWWPVLHEYNLEFIWTLIPAFILFSLSLPTFTLIYSLEDIVVPQVLVKIIGHQWYWSYEFTNFTYNPQEMGDAALTVEHNRFDSIMYPSDMVRLEQEVYRRRESVGLETLLEKEPKLFRLLDVDNNLVLPAHTHLRFFITSADVLHSWAVPSLGIKMDACPGRLNQVNVYINRLGTFYGQCSEICGINHRFMPICIKAI